MPPALVESETKFSQASPTSSTSGPPSLGARLLTCSARCAVGNAKHEVNFAAAICAACDRDETAGFGAVTVAPAVVAVARTMGVGLSMVVSASLPLAGSV